MSFEVVRLIGPADAVAVRESKTAPETVENLFVSMTDQMPHQVHLFRSR
jgi:hypothetical protein